MASSNVSLAVFLSRPPPTPSPAERRGKKGTHGDKIPIRPIGVAVQRALCTRRAESTARISVEISSPAGASGRKTKGERTGAPGGRRGTPAAGVGGWVCARRTKDRERSSCVVRSWTWWSGCSAFFSPRCSWRNSQNLFEQLWLQLKI